MKWLNSIVAFITAIGSLPPKVVLTFLGIVTVLFVLLIALVRFSGVKKLSVTGAEFGDGDPGTPKKKPTSRRRTLKK